MCTYSERGTSFMSRRSSLRRSRAGLEPAAQIADRAAAVTQPIFLVGIELRGGHLELGQPEMRVVAESSGTARRIDDIPLPSTVGGERRSIVRPVHVHQNATIARTPPRRRDAGERAQELGIVRGIIRTAARVARGID